MPAITNKTRAPLSVPLPRGKTLHLGLGKTADISAGALEHAAVKKLIEEGKIELADEGSRSGGPTGGGTKIRGAAQSHASSATVRSSGDR